MADSSKSSGILLLVVMAFIGFALISLPTLLVEQYEMLKDADPLWRTVYGATAGTGFLLLMLCCLWILWKVWRATVHKRKRRARQALSPREMTPAQREQEVQENLAAIDDLRSDASVDDQLRREIDPMVARLEKKRESKSLEIVAFGTVSSGKSSLLNALAGREVFASDARGGTTTRRNEIPWPGDDRVMLVDTPGLGEVDGEERQSVSATAAKDADIVLLVVDGPLRDSEFQLLSTLGQMDKPVVICLNKEDWYSSEERDVLLRQIAQQLKEVVRREDIVAVRSRPATRTRVRVLADQSEAEEEIEVEPDITPLAERLMRLVERDGTDLLMANLLLQSRGLVEQSRQKVREALDRRAWSIVENYMWGAGGAAALSPLPMVDLVAGCAISTKMVVDLARVYRQDIDLDAAVRLIGQLGKTLLATLGTSAAMPALMSVVASMLKTVPGAGTIAGGALQGVVIALVTRWIGGVFIVYFRNEMQESPGGLSALARKEWERATRADELRKLVKSTRSKLAEARDNKGNDR